MNTTTRKFLAHPVDQFSRLTTCLVLLLASAGCEEPRGSGSIDGMDLGWQVELHLQQLAPAEVSTEALAMARGLFADPPDLDHLRVYTAESEIEERPVNLRIGVLALGDEPGAGYLAAVVDSEGAQVGFRVWGHPDFDTDPTAAWENFWRQFQYKKRRSTFDPATALSDSAATAYWLSASIDSSLGVPRTALYEHGVLMTNQSFLIRHTMARTGRGENPGVEWYEAYGEEVDRLQQIADAFRTGIGNNGVEEYETVMEDGRDILRTLSTHARAGAVEPLRSAILEYRRRTCGTCHRSENHSGSGGLQTAVFTQFDAWDVRNDLFQVGRDVWGVPGEAERSQRIASAAKAVLAVLHGI